MSHYVGQYSSKCDLCLCTKVQCHLPVGELQPLPVSEEHWDAISVYFIAELHESGSYNAIMVVVDSVSKWAHFVKVVTTIMVAGSAKLYL